MGRVVKAASISRRPGRLEDKGARLEDPTAKELAKACLGRDLEVIDLALGLARRVVGDAVQADPGALEEIYVRTLETGGGLSPAVLRINPRDGGLVDREELRSRGDLEIVEDESVARFGCVFEACGVRIERGLEALASQLRAVIEEGTS